MSRISLLAGVLLAASGLVHEVEGSEAEAAFQKLQVLVGEWEATRSDGQRAETNFRLVANGFTFA